MDFTLSGEARELAGLTRDIAGSGRPLWPALAEAGVLAAALPKRAGGEGHGLPEQCAILIELGRHAAGVPYLPSIVGAASAIARFGTDEQVTEWAAPAGRGELTLTVAGPGSTPAAAEAALALVPVDDEIALVRPQVQPQEVSGSPGAGRLVAAAGGAQRIAGAAWLRARLTVGACATQLGIVERALEMTASYARERIQFGRPIGSFQAVSQRLADAWIDVEALRLALWQAVCAPEPAEIATAGFWAAEAGHRVLHTAVHVHGGVGIDMDHPLHRYVLAAEYHEFLLGGATSQLLDLSEVL
ncbi:acyl-CoA dehydrogenase family protein [Actinoplanes utahensis]|uniref:Acyl-CoA dehydrogenase n=1 Tax=Actinoplanes utahensis TaxID=1869 RepID=A0A0A6X8F3_ACTUT|nr:acyl-CoA dehydrogenase family protein [Actinoplanes utahensis]KHD76407.1 acyl-CoA dehydrogenase [Actinoplanes utahensis]GIF29816.1 acyl-CoA dehydrogenase [Actinoplanes utahensis]